MHPDKTNESNVFLEIISRQGRERQASHPQVARVLGNIKQGNMRGGDIQRVGGGTMERLASEGCFKEQSWSSGTGRSVSNAEETAAVEDLRQTWAWCGSKRTDIKCLQRGFRVTPQ